VVVSVGLIVHSAAVPLEVERGEEVGAADQPDVRPRSLADSGDYYYNNDDSRLLKRLQNDVDGDVEKRRFCRHNYVYNPVSGRCQASLLVSITSFAYCAIASMQR